MRAGGFLQSFALLLREIGRALARYVRGQILIAIILSLFYVAGFALLGVPAWAFTGVVCGFSHLVPVFGSVLGLAFAVLITLAGGAGWYRALGVFGIFALAQAFESFYLTPRVLGSSVHLPPLAVFLALLFAGMFFGFLGILLAVPLMAIAAVTWRFFRRER